MAAPNKPTFFQPLPEGHCHSPYPENRPGSAGSSLPTHDSALEAIRLLIFYLKAYDVEVAVSMEDLKELKKVIKKEVEKLGGV